MKDTALLATGNDRGVVGFAKAKAQQLRLLSKGYVIEEFLGLGSLNLAYVLLMLMILPLISSVEDASLFILRIVWQLLMVDARLKSRVLWFFTSLCN